MAETTPRCRIPSTEARFKLLVLNEIVRNPSLKTRFGIFTVTKVELLPTKLAETLVRTGRFKVVRTVPDTSKFVTVTCCSEGSASVASTRQPLTVNVPQETKPAKLKLVRELQLVPLNVPVMVWSPGTLRVRSELQAEMSKSPPTLNKPGRLNAAIGVLPSRSEPPTLVRLAKLGAVIAVADRFISVPTVAKAGRLTVVSAASKLPSTEVTTVVRSGASNEVRFGQPKNETVPFPSNPTSSNAGKESVA